jgi:hypothetical protein
VNTKDVGNISEAFVTAELLKLGRTVLIPYGDNERYDLVIDNKDGTFTRVQVKTGRIRNGAVIFSTGNANPPANGRRESRNYNGYADVFIVYSPELNQCYWIPVAEAAKVSMRLRVSPSIRRNDKYRLAKNYELGRYLTGCETLPDKQV